SDPPGFHQAWQVALSQAVSWTECARAEAEVRTREAWTHCATLAHEPNILNRFAQDLKGTGVVGEVRAAKLIYLALTSRFLERPVSCAVKGPSSGGKSFVTGSVLKFFPAGAYHALSAMSERTLAYSQEPLANRFLVIYEAAALQSEFGS